MTSFISNGTDVVNTVMPEFFVDNTRAWRIQLTPTLLFKNERDEQGEIWRAIPAYEREPDKGIWDSTATGDVDLVRYAGSSA